MKTVKYVFEITCFFLHNLVPAHRAVVDCSPRKESPGRVPATVDSILFNFE